MPNTKAQTALAVLGTANEIAEAVLPQIQMAFVAYHLLEQLWKKEDPGMTFQQYNERLGNESKGMADFSLAFLSSHGYVQQPDGSWKKQA